MNVTESIESADFTVEKWDDRTRRVLGEDAANRLADASVLVVGVGGVGGYAAEMLVRSGIGKITLIDADEVAPSNINRQIMALRSTVGMPKSIVAAERLHDINPEASISTLRMYLAPEHVDEILDAGFDFVLDCIDTVAPKVSLLAGCLRRRIPVVSSMGAGGRVDPTCIRYSDIWSTRDDGLARAVRNRLKKLGVRRPLMTVCSTEPPRKQSLMQINDINKRSSYGSLASIPSVFGIYMANYVIRKIGKI